MISGMKLANIAYDAASDIRANQTDNVDNTISALRSARNDITSSLTAFS